MVEQELGIHFAGNLGALFKGLLWFANVPFFGSSHLFRWQSAILVQSAHM